MSAGKELVSDVALQRWNSLLEQISTGVKLEDACLAAGVTSTEITVFTLSSLEAQRWADACLSAKRRRWPQLHIDDILEKFAAGMDLEAAIEQVRGSSKDAGEFFELLDLPALSERYAAAQRARTLRSAESLKAIADDDSKDIIVNDKGPAPNMANVQRSRLRIETRQALNAAWHPDRFSEKGRNQVAVQVNVSLGEKLEAAQTRAKLRGTKPPAVTKDAIDAAFSEVPVEAAVVEKPDPKAAPVAMVEKAEAKANAAQWVDEEPAEDTTPLPAVWLEET